MDKPERETLDFMNVESFSQLPFIRTPPPPKEKSNIRLFGIEFGDTPLRATYESESTTKNNAFQLDRNNKDNNNNTGNVESSRRFECHYCCRNFPTSQALGGHQNAHKRERQHAKRAHLQSSMVHSSLYDAHVYGLTNYRFGGSATTIWNSSSSRSSAMIGGGGGDGGGGGGRRFYGSIGHESLYSHHQQPINGSPLAFWRGTGVVHSNPVFNRERSLDPLPLFAGEEMNTGLGGSRVSLSAGSQNRYVYDSKPIVNDNVSLDLRL